MEICVSSIPSNIVHQCTVYFGVYFFQIFPDGLSHWFPKYDVKIKRVPQSVTREFLNTFLY